jgi:hypothetical protein
MARASDDAMGPRGRLHMSRSVERITLYRVGKWLRCSPNLLERLARPGIRIYRRGRVRLVRGADLGLLWIRLKIWRRRPWR